jgi:hypothetical protein
MGTSSFSQTFSAAAAVKGEQNSTAHQGRGNEKKSDPAKTSTSTSQPATAAAVPTPAQPVTPPPLAAAQPFGTQTAAGDDQPGSQTIQPVSGNSNGVAGQDEIAVGGLEVAPAANAAASADAAVDGEETGSDASIAGAIAEQGTANAAAAAADQPLPLALDQSPIAGVQSTDLSATPVDGKLAASASSEKDGSSKVAGTSAKNSKTGSSDVRSKQKSTDSDSQNSVAASSNSSSFKVVAAMAHADHGGSAAQQGTGDAMVQQAAQAAVSAATDSKQAVVQSGESAATVPQVAANVATQSTVADVQSLPAVNSAQLIQSMHQSEMRLGMYSAEFGSISISTSLTHQSIAAQISMDHSALGNALAAHLPAIEEKLSNAYGVQARVEVREGSAFLGNSSGHSEDRQQGHANNFTPSSSTLPHAMRAITHSTSALAADSLRLDIRI